MPYAVICHDKPGALPIRMENRSAHLAYIQATGCVALAGPFLDEQGTMCGSLLILSLNSLAEAQAWAAGDPYDKAGLFAQVSVTEWKRVIG